MLWQTQCTISIPLPEIKGTVLWACINLGTIFYQGGSADWRRKLHFQCASPQKPPNLDRVNCYGKPNVLFLYHFLRLKVQFYGLVLIWAQFSIKARVEIGEGSCISNVPVLKSHLIWMFFISSAMLKTLLSKVRFLDFCLKSVILHSFPHQ